jgi:hypothetical protein
MFDAADGLLTTDNSVIAFVDLRTSSSAPHSRHHHAPLQNSLMLAKAAMLLGVPQLHTSLGCADTLLPEHKSMVRTSTSCWDDRYFVDSLLATRRSKVIFAGFGTATFVTLPVIQALHDGYEVYVVEDCCRDMTRMAHDNGMQRMIQAGARPLTALALLLEWQRDWLPSTRCSALIDIVGAHIGTAALDNYLPMAKHKKPCPVYPGYVAPVPG